MTDIGVIFEPNQARSIYADFNPAKRGSGNLGYAQGGYITKKAKGGSVERVYNDRKYI